MANLILFAEDDRFTELVNGSGLPRNLWCNCGEGNHTANCPNMESKSQLIHRRDPARFLEPIKLEHLTEDTEKKRAERLTQQYQDMLFSELLRSTVCHLVILDEILAKKRSDGEKSNNLQGIDNLGKLFDWYKRFAKAAELSTNKRHREYNHVLILVAVDNLILSMEDLDCLQALLQGAGADLPLIDACYLMTRQLELGPNDSFHAEHIWPIYIGRLLLSLAFRKEIPRSEHLRIWRALEFLPRVDKQIAEKSFFEGMKMAYGQLESEGHADLDRFYPKPFPIPKPDLADKEIPKAEFWHKFPVENITDKVISDQRWDGELVNVGRTFNLALGREILRKEPSARMEVRNVWGAVHQQHSLVYTAKKQLENVLSNVDLSLTKRLKDIHLAEEKIRDTDRERDALAEKTLGCAPVFQEAQSAFVEYGFRLAIGFAVTLLVAYFAMTLLRSLGAIILPDMAGAFRWISIITVGLAAGVGALAGSLLPWFLEKIAGKRAMEGYSEFLGSLDKNVKERHKNCQDLIQASYTYLNALRSKAAAKRLLLLLTRVIAVLQTELFPKDPGVQPGETALELPGDTTDVFTWMSRKERIGFRKKTSIDVEADFDLDHSKIKAIVDSRLSPDDLSCIAKDENLTFMWQAFCSKNDPAQAGNLPASALIPKLRDFCYGMHQAIMEELHRQAVKGAAEKNAGKNILDKSLEPLDFHYYFSALAPDGMDPSKVNQRLYLRRQLAKELAVNRRIPVDSPPLLERIPAYAYFFEEAEISIRRKDDGAVSLVNP